MNTLTVPATHWASKLLRTASAELILAFITSSTSPEMKDCAVATLAVSLSYTRKEKESGFHINLRNVLEVKFNIGCVFNNGNGSSQAMKLEMKLLLTQRSI